MRSSLSVYGLAYRVVLLLTLFILPSLGWSQAEGFRTLPRAYVELTPEAVTLQSPMRTLAYQYGVGWSDGRGDAPPEVTDDGAVRVSSSIVEALGIPALREVRSGRDGDTTRLVLELDGLARGDVPTMEGTQSLTASNALRLVLPAIALPTDGNLLLGDAVRVDVAWTADGSRTEVRIEGDGVDVRAFSLDAPVRLVLDLTPRIEGPERVATPDASPLPGPAKGAATTQLAPGVHYRTFDVTTPRGDSRVHVTDLDPTQVRFELALATNGGETVHAMADGAIAAINAGYFDPSTFTPIGLRTLDGVLVTSPSRNRAVVGFTPVGTVVARAGASVELRIDQGLPIPFELEGQGPLSWSTLSGTTVGGRRVGVLEVDASGIVLRNGVGPTLVPEGGLAIAYDPSLRTLALVNPGQRVTLTSRLAPPRLAQSAWAVEAGPLLVQDGVMAFTPELEGFARGVRILDQPTQQAGLGVMPDGRVLFVVADAMIAEELARLFLDLGVDRALRLDSGSSATLVADGRTVNRVVSRRVESAILAFPTTLAESER